jgi:hypothetical protein
LPSLERSVLGLLLGQGTVGANVTLVADPAGQADAVEVFEYLHTALATDAQLSRNAATCTIGDPAASCSSSSAMRLSVSCG